MHSDSVYSVFFYLAVNKLINDKMQKILNLISEQLKKA